MPKHRRPQVSEQLDQWQRTVLSQAIADAITYRQQLDSDEDWKRAGDYRIIAASLEIQLGQH